MTSDAIQLPDTPGIHGLRFRHFRGGDDFNHMAAITRVSAETDNTERADTPEELANFFAHLTNCNPYTDMIFAEVDPGDGREPEVIGYSCGTWRMEGSGERRYMFFGRILPLWRRKGIGHAMLRWMEGRLREIAAGHPTEVEKYFLSFVAQGEIGLAAMLEKTGYQPVRYWFEMVRPDLENIPNYSLPEGLEVRQVLPEHYRAIWEADIEAFRDHWGFTEPGEQDYQAWLVDKTIFQPELWQVAWDIASNQVAGQVRTFIDHEQNKLYDRQRGWTEFISVRRPFRRRGLARALIARSLRVQKQAGMIESALGVDGENLSGATKVYEDSGFRVVKRNTIYRKPLITIA
ncbi:MAG: GNAT family N-acetyltransferase [Anaerolineales bacterium]